MCGLYVNFANAENWLICVILGHIVVAMNFVTINLCVWSCGMFL